MTMFAAYRCQWCGAEAQRCAEARASRPPRVCCPDCCHEPPDPADKLPPITPQEG